MTCTSKTHRLERVFSTAESSYGESTVVRWCRVCGAIVVDTDVDGRTYPGAVMKMKLPEVAKQGSQSWV